MARTALVTGANRGIGQQVARMLAHDGWDVLVGARDRQHGAAAVTRLRKDGGRLKLVELDVTSDDSVALAARKLRDGAIELDALVNNAGVYGKGSVAQTIETNFFGPLRVTLAMLPRLRDGATITNVTSELGSLSRLAPERRALLADPALTRDQLVAAMHAVVRDGSDGRGLPPAISGAEGSRGSIASWGTDAYGISKAALDALTRIFSRELAGRGIRVNATCPGWVRTEMGGRDAPRSIEQGALSVLFGVTATTTGGVFQDGRRID